MSGAAVVTVSVTAAPVLPGQTSVHCGSSSSGPGVCVSSCLPSLQTESDSINDRGSTLWCGCVEEGGGQRRTGLTQGAGIKGGIWEMEPQQQERAECRCHFPPGPVPGLSTFRMCPCTRPQPVELPCSDSAALRLSLPCPCMSSAVSKHGLSSLSVPGPQSSLDPSLVTT